MKPLFVTGEASEEPLTLGDVLASDTEDPAHTAARNLDWQSFIATLDERTLAVLNCMAEEVRLLELAFDRGVGRSTIQGWRERLTRLARTFLGAEVICQVQTAPRWQDQVRASRERTACRLERRSA